MVRAFEVTLHPPVGRHLSLVDVRELTAIDSVGFEIIQDYMLSRRDAFEPVVERQALLCRADAFGAAIIGMYHFVAPRYPFEVFTSLDAALEFLSPPRRAEIGAELEGLREQVFGTAPFLLQLRASLAESKTIPSLAELAQAFGMSQRTFQRRLAQHRTSYELELTRWRISRAEELLANTALSLTDVAKRVGFAGSSSFVAAFRTARGVPPEAWRRQHRPTRG